MSLISGVHKGRPRPSPSRLMADIPDGRPTRRSEARRDVRRWRCSWRMFRRTLDHRAGSPRGTSATRRRGGGHLSSAAFRRRTPLRRQCGRPDYLFIYLFHFLLSYSCRNFNSVNCIFGNLLFFIVEVSAGCLWRCPSLCSGRSL